MPNLFGTKDDATSQPVILKRHGQNAIAFGEDVKAGSAVPGGTDNDLDSWLTYLASRPAGSSSNGIAVVSTLPTDLSSYDVNDPIILTDKDGSYTPGVYVVEEDTQSYWESTVTPDHIDNITYSIIRHFDHNPQDSVGFIFWDTNSTNRVVELALSRTVFGSKPANVYLEVTQVNGSDLATPVRVHLRPDNDLSDYWYFVGTSTELSEDNIAPVDQLIRFSLFSDAGYSVSLVSGSSKYWKDVTAQLDSYTDLARKIFAVEQLANADKLESDSNRNLIDQIKGESEIDLEWNSLNQTEIDAGVGFFFQSGTTVVVPDNEFTANSRTVTDGNYRLYLRIPKNINPGKYRIVNTQSADNTLINAFPVDGQEWNEFEGVLQSDSSRYTYWELYSEDTSLAQRVIFAAVAGTGGSSRLGLQSASRTASLNIPLSALGQSGASDRQVATWNNTEQEWEPADVETNAKGALSLVKLGGPFTLTSSTQDTTVKFSELSDVFYLVFTYRNSVELTFMTAFLKSNVGRGSSFTRVQLQGAGSSNVQISHLNDFLRFSAVASAQNSNVKVTVYNTLAGAKGEDSSGLMYDDIIHVVESLPTDFSIYKAGQQVELDGTFYVFTNSTSNHVIGHSGTRDFGRPFQGQTLYTREVGFVYPGFQNSVIGMFEHNPVDSNDNPLIGGVYSEFGTHLGLSGELDTNVFVLQSAYETAKGSAFAAGDRLTIVVSYEDENDSANNITATVSLTGDPVTDTTRRLQNGQNYLIFDNQIQVSISGPFAGSEKQKFDAQLEVLKTTHRAWWNMFQALLSGSADGENVTVSFYSGSTANSARAITGFIKDGWTKIHSDAEIEASRRSESNKKLIDANTTSIHNLEGSVGPIAQIKNELTDVEERLTDLSYGTGAPTWGIVGAVDRTDADKGKPAIAQMLDNFYPNLGVSNALQLIRALGNEQWHNEVFNPLSANAYVAIRLPRGTGDATSDPSNYRLRLTHRDDTFTYVNASHLWTPGNNTSPDVSYRFAAYYLITPSIKSARLETVTGDTHIGQTEFSGKVTGSFTLGKHDDLAGSIIALNLSQYNALTDDQKNNGKLYVISNADDKRIYLANKRIL